MQTHSGKLVEYEWYLPVTPQPKPAVHPTFTPPVSISTVHTRPDSLQTSIQQYLKVHDFLSTLQRTEGEFPTYTEFPELEWNFSPCLHQIPDSEKQRLLKIPFPEEFSEAVFETMKVGMSVLVKVKGTRRICSLSVNNGEFWTREERESSQDARVAAHMKALEWAAPGLLQEWRARYRH